MLSPASATETRMGDVREIIDRRLKELGRSKTWLSRELGRNHAYVQQYIERHSPQRLDVHDAIKVSNLLGIPLKDLDVDLPGGPPRPAPEGFAEEAEAYVPPAGSFLGQAEHIAYFRATSDSLDRHKLAIRRGDIVAVDIGADALKTLATGDAVVAQLYHKPDCMTASTVLRQYVAPGLLITNSSGENGIWRLDDDDLPFEPVIKGKIVSVIRPTNA